MLPTPEMWRHALALIAATSFAVIGATDAKAQTLPELVRTVLPSHPRIAEAKGALSAADAEVDIARAPWRPRLFADGGIGTQRSTGQYATSATMLTPSIRARQQIYDGGKADRDVEGRQARVAQVRAAYRSAEEDLALSLSQAYLQLASSQEALEITQRWVDGLSAVESLTNQIQQIDRGRRMDLLQATSRATQARALLSSRTTAVSEAARTLDALAERSVRIVRPISLVFVPDVQSSERMLNDESLLMSHPRMQAASAALDSAKAQLASSALYMQPSLDVEAFVASGRDATNRLRAVNVFGVQIVGTHTLLDGGSGRAAIRASDSRVGQAQASLDATAREVRAQLARGIGAELGRTDRLRTFESGYQQAVSLRGSMREQFQFGRRPLLDLLTQESEIYQAELALSQERIDAVYDRIQLAYARGELLHALNVPSTIVDEAAVAAVPDVPLPTRQVAVQSVSPQTATPAPR